MYLLLDRGRVHLANVNLLEAQEVFAEALDLAICMKTANAAHGAICGLGLVHSMKPAMRRQALDHAIAALLLWRLPFETRDSRTGVHLFHHLEGRPVDIERFVSVDSPLRDTVLAFLDGIPLDSCIATAVQRLDM